MREELKTGAPVTADEIMKVAEKLVGAKKLAKEVSGSAEFVVKESGADAVIKKFNELSKAIQEYQSLLKDNKTIGSKAKSYFGSEEKMINNLKESWNEYVKDVKNGKVDFDNIQDSQSAKKVLRNANAVDAMIRINPANSSALKEFREQNEEIFTMVEKMRNMPLFMEGNYNSDIGNFVEAFRPLVNIFNALNEAIERSGMTMEERLKVLQGLKLDKFDEIARPVKELLSIGTEKDGKAKSGFGMGNGAEEAEDAADKMKEAAKKYIEATEEIMQAKLNASHSRKNVSEDDVWGWEAYDERSISKIQDKLKELQKNKQDALEMATYYNNKLAKGQSSNPESDEHWLNNYIEEYHKASDQIEFVQKELTDATLNFKPGDSWGTDEIQALIALLQELQRQISSISESFSQLSSGDQFSSIVKSLGSIGDAFNVDNIMSFNNQLALMLENLQTIASKKFENKIELPSDSNGDAITRKEDDYLRSEFIRYKKAYDRVMQAAERSASKISGDTGQEYLFGAMLQNRKVVNQFGNQENLAKRFSISSIENANIPYLQRIETIQEFFKYIRQLRPGDYGNDDLWKQVRKLSLPSSDMARINKRLRQIHESGETPEIDEEKMDETLSSFKLSDSFADSESFNQLLAVIKEIKVVLDGGISAESFDTLFASITSLIDKFSELNSVVKEFKESFDLKDTIPTEAIESITNVLKSGFGIKENGELSYLEQLISKLRELIDLQKLAEGVPVFRGTNGDNPITTSKSGATFWVNKKSIARQYGTDGPDKTLFGARVQMNNPLQIDAKGAQYDSITYLGDGADEASRSILQLTAHAEECRQALQQMQNIDPTDTESLQKSVQIAQDYSETLKKIKEISEDTTNPYGTHSTDWFAEYAKNNGYDGVHIRDVVDTTSAYDSDQKPSDIYVTFTEEQIKNAQMLEKANHAVAESQREVTETAEQMKQSSGSSEASVSAILDKIKNKGALKDYFGDFNIFEKSEEELRKLFSVIQDLGGMDILKDVGLSRVDYDDLLDKFEEIGLLKEKVPRMRDQQKKEPQKQPELENIAQKEDMAKYVSQLDLAKSSAEELSGVLKKVSEFGGIDKLDLPADKVKEFTDRLEELGLAEKTIGDSAGDINAPLSSSADAIAAEGKSAEDAANKKKMMTEANEELANSGKTTAQNIKPASEAVAGEGKAATNAAAEKDKATKANKELAASAKETQNTTENAADGIKKEETAVETLQDTAAVNDPRRRGIYKSQRNLIGDDDYSITEKIGYATTRTEHHRFKQDENGDLQEQVTEQSFTDFEKLENKIREVDSQVTTLVHNIQQNLAQGLPVDAMLDDLDRLGREQAELLQEANLYFTNNGYAPGDEHVQDFYRRVMDNRNAVVNRLRQRDDENAAYASDPQALINGIRQAEESAQEAADAEAALAQARREGAEQTREQEKRDRDWEKMEADRQKDIDTIEERRVAAERSQRDREDSIIRQEAAALNKEQERQWKEAQKRQEAEPAFQAQQSVRLAQLLRLKQQVEDQGLVFDMSRFDDMFEKLSNLEVGDQNGLKEYQAQLEQIRIDAEAAAESIGKIFENSRKADHTQWQGEFKDKVNEMSASPKDRWWNKEGFHDNKGNWTGALAEEAMQADADFEALRGKYEQYLQALKNLESVSSEYEKSPSNFFDALKNARLDVSRIFGELNTLVGSIDTSKFSTEQMSAIDEIQGKIEIQKGRESAKIDQQAWTQDIEILEKYAKAQTELNQIQAKSVSGELTVEQKNRKAQLESEISTVLEAVEAYNRLNQAKADGKVSDKQYASANVDDLYKRALLGTSSSRSQYESNIAKLFKGVDSRLQKAKAGDEEFGGWRPSGWADKISELEERIKVLKTQAASIDIGNPDAADQFAKIRNGIQDVQNAYTNLSKSEEWKPVDTTWGDSFGTKIAKWMDSNKIAAKAYKDELKQLRDEIENVGSAADASDLENRFSKIQMEAADKGLLGKSLTDRFKDQFKNTMTSLATYYLSFQDFIRYGREAIQTVTELDTAMTELKKVSNESAQSYNTFMKESFDIADTVGGTAKQIIQSTADWKRLGKSFEESQEAAQASVKLLNVSEFESIDDATTSLVSMKQSFSDLSYDDFIDKLNGVGDAFSSSTDQLAYGMKNVSAVLKVSGNDIDQSLALLTAAKLLAVIYGNIIQRTYLIALIT